MKKIWKKVLVVLFILCLSIIALGVSKSIESQYTIDTPYKYPVLPGTQEWVDLGNVFRRRDACQIPEDVLHKMTTDALFQTILDYPFLNDMYAFDSLQIGYETVKRRFNGLQEFESRPDYLDVLLCYCQESHSLDEDEKTLKDYMTERILQVLSADFDSSFSSYASTQYATYATVPTPNKNLVGAVKGRVYDVHPPAGASWMGTYTQEEMKDSIERDKLKYSTATLLRGSSQPNLTAYNCYSYALYDQSYNNDYFLGNFSSYPGAWKYFTDESYIKNTGRPAVGQILVYGYALEEDPEITGIDIYHVGIINTLYRNDVNKVVSKWGHSGLWLHQWMDCPYAEETNYHSAVYEKASDVS